MSAQSPIELKNDHNVIEATDPLGGTPNIGACSGQFVLLVDLTWTRTLELLETFVDQYERALVEHFLQPTGKTHGRAPVFQDRIDNLASPLALSAIFGKTKSSDDRRNVTGRFCTRNALMAAVLEAGISVTPPPGTKKPSAWVILDQDLETQRKIAHAIVAPNIRTMAWAKESSGLHFLATERLYEIARDSTSSIEFFRKICGILMEWILLDETKGRHGKKLTYRTEAFDRPYVLMWFCMWLAEQSLLLFPIEVLNHQTEIYLLSFRPLLMELLRDKADQEACDAYLLKLAKLLSFDEEKRSRTRVSVDTINLLHPGAAHGRVSAQCLNAIKVRYRPRDAQRRNIMNTMWDIEAARLRSAGVDSKVIKSLTEVALYHSRSRGQDHGLWAWVDYDEALPHGKRPRYRYKYARSDFRPGPNIKSHLEDLRHIFPIIAGNSAQSIVSKINIWLYFLTSLNDGSVPARFVDITPRLLASIDEGDVTTFRGFMVSEQIDLHTGALTFSLLDKAWRVAARESDTDNLISPVSELLKSAKEFGHERNAVSTRRAIDMEILELLIAENRSDDFAFSRNRRSRSNLDTRRVTDPDSGDVIKI